MREKGIEVEENEGISTDIHLLVAGECIDILQLALTYVLFVHNLTA